MHGKFCRAFWSDLKIVVAGRVHYLQVAVTCRPVPRGTDIVPSPVVVFEVFSSSTASTDRIAKNEEYRQTPTIQHYVMLEQASQAAMIFSGAGDDRVGRALTGGAMLSFPQIGVELPLGEAYSGIEFDPPTAEDDLITP